jgi:Cu-processing system permease protein
LFIELKDARMDVRTIFEIGRHELTINIRTKWTVIFAVAFGILVVGIAYFGIMAEGFSGMENFTRTSASMLNLVLYLVPLVALTMGTLSFTGDRGITELLFAQPISRSEVLLGKLAGLLASLSLSMLAGFFAAGAVIMTFNGEEGLLAYGSFVLLSLMLAFVFLCISASIATINRRKAKAFGGALFLWFFFVLFYDLLALGITLLLGGQTANYFLFISLFGNPVDMVRVAALILLDNVTIFGAAGAALLRFLGGPGLSVALLAVGLGLWIAGPLLLAQKFLRDQDI